MQILTVSDKIEKRFLKHNTLEKACADVKLILACGDLPASYLEYITSVLNVPLFYVLGNHDVAPDRHFARGCTCIDETCIRFKNLLIAGLSGSIAYRKGPFMYTEKDMCGKMAKLFPSLLLNRIKYGRYLDILITHSPPAGIHEGEDAPHKGFAAITRFVKKFRPRFHIHGHTRFKGPGRETVLYSTTIVNTNHYLIMDI